MTAAGKSLKEIFDAASGQMLSMEKEVNSRLKQGSRDHADSRKAGDNGSVARVDERAHELDKELRTFMTDSIERLQKVMESEIKETEEHLKSVKFDLSMLADKLKNQIIELRQSYEENVNNLCMSLADNYEGAVESSTSELERQDFASTKILRGHSTTVTNTLQQKLDHSLWESRGEEKQYVSTLFKAFMQKANSIDTHFSSVMQKLSTDFQGHFKVVEDQQGMSEPELQKAAENLASEVEGYASQVQEDVQKLFKAAVEDHSKKLDSNLGRVAQDLSSVHDATTERLSTQTKQMSAGLVTASGEARESLTTKCTTLREQVDSMMSAFNSRLEDKLKNTQALKETLDSEKASIFEDIRKELSEIRDGFEKRLSALMSESVERVTTISGEAEKDISDAFKRSEAELRSQGNQAKDEIEQAVGEFIRLLAEQRKTALEQIAKSAGSTAEDAESKSADSTRPGRRARRKDETLPEAEF